MLVWKCCCVCVTVELYSSTETIIRASYSWKARRPYGIQRFYIARPFSQRVQAGSLKMNTALEYRVCTSTTRTGYFKCREVKTGFYRNKSMQTGSSGTLIGWKSGQTTFVPLWDRMEGAWLRTQYKSVPGGGPTGRRCKKSTLNDLVHLTPLRIPLMNPPSVYYSNGLFPTAVYARVRAHVEHI